MLLHSTGGDEHQLVEIAEMIAPSHPILSIRGRINEQGVNRYFKLRGLGGFTKENFDLESLDEETDWLTDEVSLLAENMTLTSINDSYRLFKWCKCSFEYVS